ncbi:uncharacterized protein SRS1_10115 [Sporisorium reilianum f. sp. reilianum]|uniref:Cutinase n=1 Tax=Sporisorium reilianum f. sp. reilianum TaxID=72559 RepID=A0A2N8U870_9BASI|nr:uncharacterized protein SRS1_10115 [Sporisorium reilianum f. sp. reilianum]
MLFTSTFATLALATVGAVQAAPHASEAPLEKRAACTKYVIIDTRGTGEAQGPSAGFRTMNQRIFSTVSGGTEYDTVYPAGYNQDSSQGSADIVRKVQSTLAQNPSTCFILEGYSQGAAATVDAMPKLTGANFDAVKGVILIGDSEHKPNLACNVDGNGGKTTYSSTGISSFKAGIPSTWVSKTIDICIYGDGVCDSQHGYGITCQHLQYPNNANVQTMGANFAIKALQG